jgi:predicted component of type VI protein secretion system
MGWLALGMTTREIGDGPVIIGSGGDAGWRITSADLAARHFVIDTQGESATIRANSIDNVVVLNGRQVGVTAEPIGDNDTVLAGTGRFTYTIDPPLIIPGDDPPIRAAHLIDDAGRIAHPLVGRTTPIGRDASNAVVVRDPSVSRFHAEVRREAGGYAVHSTGMSGTLLNGQPLEGAFILYEGDTVEIEGTQLRFTTAPPRAGVRVATPHSTQNDEVGKKPTLAKGSAAIPAKRPTPTPAKKSGGLVPILLVSAVVVAGVAYFVLSSRA